MRDLKIKSTIALVFALVAVLFTAASADDSAGVAIAPDTCRPLDMPFDSVEVDSSFRDLINDAFGVGEWLKFDLKYSFVTAGYAEMSVDSIFEHNGRECYMITTRARSHPFFDSFYKVRDHGETWFDAYGMFPWRFEKHLREGSYERDEVHEFDQYRGLVYEGDDTIMVMDYIQDVLSSLYYVRSLDLDVGDRISVGSYTKKKCHQLEVIVHAREEIKVDAGKFRCLKVEPLLKSAGLFKHEGKLTVWLTDDRLKMPVLMKSKVLVGSITAELTDFRLGELLD